MREIVFDTETTGLSFSGGDRLVEIGCVELVNRVMTGRTFHAYVNPERPMPIEAFNVHGLSERFLSDKPLFHDVVEDLLEFIGDSPMVAHNAGFDFGFLNGELGAAAARSSISAGWSIRWHRARSIPAPSTRSTRCARATASISASAPCTARCSTRQLLAQVYVELTGGRQITLAWRSTRR
jgi:DNA polymerase-3 subunit epsilon